MDTRSLMFNGINGDTGEYLLPPLAPEELTALAKGAKDEPRHLAGLDSGRRPAKEPVCTARDGVDGKTGPETGWGFGFPAGADSAVRDAFAKLLDYRRDQAAAEKAGRYQEYTAERGY